MNKQIQDQIGQKLPLLTEDWKMNYASLLQYHLDETRKLQIQIQEEQEQNKLLHHLVENQKSKHEIQKMLNTSNNRNKCIIL